ncbi:MULTISPECIES: helix-turn-helix transcriptional regulator [unclassified Streptomyces]|uniref:helix-turn-helix domain-containing protein n=1 Tax=unclassified Streptomyces TaxID=2593676 RepID=UPI00039DAB3F|nr:MULTISPECIES: helix-turn-helix transcriptional regulator [unclassified Streptomyces]
MDDTSETTVERFRALIVELAERAGYDLTSGAGGRKQLAAATGMSQSAVSRMVDGITLPHPNQFEGLARALHTDVWTLLITAGVVSATTSPKYPNQDVGSQSEPIQPLTPELAADAWGIHDPSIRSMLIANIEHARRLQNELDNSGGARARG